MIQFSSRNHAIALIFMQTGISTTALAAPPLAARLLEAAEGAPRSLRLEAIVPRPKAGALRAELPAKTDLIQPQVGPKTLINSRGEFLTQKAPLVRTRSQANPVHFEKTEPLDRLKDLQFEYEEHISRHPLPTHRFEMKFVWRHHYNYLKNLFARKTENYVFYEFPGHPPGSSPSARTLHDLESGLESSAALLWKTMWDDIPTKGLRVDAFRNELLKDFHERAMLFLEARNIPYRLEGSTSPLTLDLQIVLLPQSKGSPIGRLAHGLKKKGYELVIHTGDTLHEHTLGWFDEVGKKLAINYWDLLTLTLPKSEALRRFADSNDQSLTARSLRKRMKEGLGLTALHELRHLFLTQDALKGAPNIFHGSFLSEGSHLPGVKAGAPYAEYMSIQELETFYFQARLAAKRLKRLTDAQPDTKSGRVASIEMSLFDLSGYVEMGEELATRAGSLASLAESALLQGAKITSITRRSRPALQLDISSTQLGDAPWSLTFEHPPGITGPEEFIKMRIRELKEFAQMRRAEFQTAKTRLAEIEQSMQSRGSPDLARVRALEKLLKARRDAGGEKTEEGLHFPSPETRIQELDQSWEAAIKHELKR